MYGRRGAACACSISPGSASARSRRSTWRTTVPTSSRWSRAEHPDGLRLTPPFAGSQARDQPQPVLRQLQLLEEEHQHRHDHDGGQGPGPPARPALRRHRRELPGRHDGQVGPGLRAAAPAPARHHLFATCLQGQTGPRARFAGFGTQLAAIAGLLPPVRLLAETSSRRRTAPTPTSSPPGSAASRCSRRSITAAAPGRAR